MKALPGYSNVRAQANESGQSDGAELIRKTRRSFGRALLLAFAVTAACNLVSLAVPLNAMALYNVVLNTRNTTTFFWFIGGVTFAIAIYGALEYARAILYDTMAERSASSLSLPVLLAANRVSDTRASATSNEVIRDLGELRSFVSGQAITTPLDLIWSPVMILVLFLMHWAFGVLALLCVTILFGLSFGTDMLTRRSFEEANEDTLRSFTEISTALRNAEAVEGLGMLPALTRRWRASQDQMLEKLWRATRAAKAFTASIKACRLLMTGCMVCLGLILTINGEATGGAMLATNMILARLLVPFQQITSSWRSWVSAAATWRRVSACIMEPRSQRGTIPLPCPNGALVVDRLVYIPPQVDHPVLRGVSFRIEPGEVLGVIGPSGGGKSTLARLIVGVLEPTAGGVWLDGNSTWHWERGDFGRYIGYMPQATMLLDGTIAENIARLRDFEPRDVIAVSHQVGIHDAIMRLPHGYATAIGQSGFLLSGGQRQRLALARALFGNPKLLVLDEPNSNLDEEGEAALLAAIGAARDQGTSVMMIAHRPSVVTIADKLLVLKDGMVDRFGARQTVLQALSAPPVKLLQAASDEGPRPALSVAR